MPASAEFCEHLLDLLMPLGPVKARRMFGGFGLYYGELAFAIVFDDALYLKADAENRPDFEAEGCAPFTYLAKGREIALNYFAPPEHALDDGEELCRWARGAIDAALRRNAKERAKKRARPMPARRARGKVKRRARSPTPSRKSGR